MSELIIGLFLTGVIGYIPYRYLVFIGLVSENKNNLNIPVLLIFSIETILICFFTYSIFLGDRLSDINNIPLMALIGTTILFGIVFFVVVFILNPLFVIFSLKVINYTRNIMKLDPIISLDKRDKLINNDKKPVFIVIKNFDDVIIDEGELLTYNSSTSDFDLLEIKRQNFQVSNLPIDDEMYTKHIIIDIKQQIKLELYLMKNH